MSSQDFPTKCLNYHREPVPGKIATELTKPCNTQEELSMAYTPGVAIPCKEIADNPDNAYQYTGKSNTVAVVSDGTAVLGLGNIGPAAAMPVMEGKAVLFKKFADIDAVPLCLTDVFDKNGNTDADLLIRHTAALAPTFGGINLEDIGAPACFQVEDELKGRMDIPVFHDDQHGTAIISLAGVLNALEIVGKKIADARMVVNGAGAAGIACTEFYISAGAKPENIIICDSKGVIHKNREEGMTERKKQLAVDTDARSLRQALEGADVFLGLSKGDCVSREMVNSMADDAIIFAMANPTPEIFPEEAFAGGAKVVGTGRTDYANQINNVLGFPGIFRGALDVNAKDINEAMKIAAGKALAELAREEVPEKVRRYLQQAYPADAEAGMFDGKSPLKPDYVIPKPFDPRVVPRVARRVAEAAMAESVHRLTIDNLDEYEQQVYDRLA